MGIGKKGLIVIAQSWPCASFGGSIAVTASLSQYQKFFDSIVFICLNENGVGWEAQKTFKSVDFRQIPVNRGSFTKRFISSLIANKPAITMGIYGTSVGTKLREIIDEQIQIPGTQFVGIIEDNVPAIYLKMLKATYAEMKWAFKSHDVLHEAFSLFKTMGNPFRRLAWTHEINKIFKLENEAVKLADINWTITKDDLILSEKCYKERINGVFDANIDLHRYGAVKPGLHTSIICLGSADSRKGHGIRLFIEKTWPLLLKNHSSKIKLILGGKGTNMFNSSKKGIEGHGYIDDEIKFLGCGTIFINPQMAGTGLKLKSLVAMASRKVLVTTKNGARGLGGIAGKHYLVVDSFQDMAFKITCLLKDVQYQNKIAEAGRKFVQENFAENSFSNRVQPLLHELWNTHVNKRYE